MRDDDKDDPPEFVDIEFPEDHHPVKTIEHISWVLAASDLFRSIETELGTKSAQRIFRLAAKAPSISKPLLKQLKVVGRYGDMKPWRNKLALAKALAEENKLLPPDQRWGGGSTDMDTMHKYVVRAIAKAEKANIHLLLKGGLDLFKPGPKKPRR
jgi:hypothetical protein